MTKQELMDEVLKLSTNDRMSLIANVAKTFMTDDEIVGNMLRCGDLRIGIVLATGSNAEIIVDMCAEFAKSSMDNDPHNQFLSYDRRDKE